MLSFIFTIFLFFIIISLIIRLLLMFFVARVNRKIQKQQETATYTTEEGGYESKEGNVIVTDLSQDEDKVVEKDMGEYVDFETVKEE